MLSCFPIAFLKFVLYVSLTQKLQSGMCKKMLSSSHNNHHQHWLSTCNEPNTLPNVCLQLPHFILPTTTYIKYYYYLHLIINEAKVTRGQVICWKVMEPRPESWTFSGKIVMSAEVIFRNSSVLFAIVSLYTLPSQTLPDTPVSARRHISYLLSKAMKQSLLMG